MRAYISISFSKRKLLQKEILAISELLNEFQIVPFVFVDNYLFNSTEEKQMMQQAIMDIDNCDFLIAETSEKAIGIGVEVGYAKAKQRPIIYLRNSNAEHSTTVAGVSDFQIVYDCMQDLRNKLLPVIIKLVHQKNNKK